MNEGGERDGSRARELEPSGNLSKQDYNKYVDIKNVLEEQLRGILGSIEFVNYRNGKRGLDEG